EAGETVRHEIADHISRSRLERSQLHGVYRTGAGHRDVMGDPEVVRAGGAADRVIRGHEMKRSAFQICLDAENQVFKLHIVADKAAELRCGSRRAAENLPL